MKMMNGKKAVLPAVLLVLALFLPSVVLGHASADNMPDSVAEVEYSIYLEFKPEDTLVRNKLGMVYYRMGKMKEAEREFSRILKKEPDNYDALDGLGLVRAAAGDYDEAIRLHRRAISLKPDDLMMYVNLGDVLEKKGLAGEALEAFRTALEKFSRQYPPGTDNKLAAELETRIRTAIDRLEAGLKKKE
ncbi:MAG: hypothetical protein Kow0089_19590 [Desulfobulbaceae bacterium]